MNSWPLDEGLIDYVSQEYVDQSPANDLYVANVIANPSIKIDGEPVDTSKITKELLSDKLQEAGGVEIERGHRLSRHRVPAVGPGPQRHRARRGQSPGDRLRREELHARATAIAARSISKSVTDLLIDDLTFMVAQWGARRRRAQGRDGGRRPRRSRRHLQGSRQPLLRRDGGRAHEARPLDPRSGGGARLLLRQHAQRALLRRARHPQRLPRQLQAPRRHRSSRAPARPTSCVPSRPRPTRARARRSRRR